MGSHGAWFRTQVTHIAVCLQAINRFRQDADTVVLLASLLASGTGITVTCASEVVLMEPYWNPFVSAVLCHAVPCCAMLRCAVLGCAEVCCAH